MPPPSVDAARVEDTARRWGCARTDARTVCDGCDAGCVPSRIGAWAARVSGVGAVRAHRRVATAATVATARVIATRSTSSPCACGVECRPEG